MRDFGQPLTSVELTAISSESPYLDGYVALSRLADRVKGVDDNYGLLGLVLAVYGWMPTIPKQIGLDHLGDVSAFIASVGACQNIDQGIELLDQREVKVVRNSWVGSSKVLHFLNPEIFPIWDRWVALALGFRSRGSYETKAQYMQYMRFLSQNLESPCVGQVQTAFHEARHPYVPTIVRSLELILYHEGQRISATATQELNMLNQ